MKRLLSCAAAAVALSGCAGLPGLVAPAPVQLTSAFDAAQAKAALRPGTGRIKGTAAIRQVGGGVVTCATSRVYLVPETLYAIERISSIYPSRYSGYVTAAEGNKRFDPDEPAYYEHQREEVCDPQGGFVFEGLAAGVYYVTTSVTWRVGYQAQGGFLMRRVELAEGATANIALTP